MATSRLASTADAFLPTGGLDYTSHSFNHSSSSNRLPPLNDTRTNGNSNTITSPSHGFPPSTLPPPIDAISPSARLPPSFSQHFHNNSLSPARQNVKPQFSENQSSPPDVTGAAVLYRSISADAAATVHAPNQLVQKLTHQNAVIREAWEAERNYLEANRRRAEEVYQEERVIMEEVREAWENEKAALLQEIQTLKERIQRLEGENTTLRAVASQGQRGGSLDASTDSPPSQQSIPPVADPSSLPPGLDGASRRPHHHVSQGGSLTSPLSQPEPSPLIPLDPRMQPQTSNPKDFLSRPAKEDEDAGPVIDVQKVDPKLEGIPLKATAVQKFTFGESSMGSPATSPPAALEASQTQKQQPLPQRLPPKDHTFQVLHAEESRRLTMHAGHTPNHSLSRFPTMSVADGSTSATQDDDTAPSQGAPSPPPEQPEKTEQQGAFYEKGTDIKTAEPQDETAAHDGDEELYQPTDDVKLKGPLMVKNIPAQDEIFWSQVNKKLEPISQGEDALPTVMRSSLGDADDAGGPSGAHRGANFAAAGGDTLHDPNATIDMEESVSDQEGVEGDVPLKLKSTTNFGAPWGTA